MKLPAIVRNITALCLLLVSSVQNASVLTIPTSNPGERQVLPPPNAHPLDAQAACASASGCQPPTGQIPSQAIDPTSANGMSDLSAPIAAVRAEASLPPAGSQTATYSHVPAYVLQAADEFTSDEDVKWKVKLRMLQAYTGIHSLASLIDTDQGNARDAGNNLSAQYQEISAVGANAGYATGGLAPNSSSVCVASDGSYNTIGAATQKACPPGSIFVSAQRSASMAEYTAYAQSLNYSAKGAASHNVLRSLDSHQTSNAPAPEQLKRCSTCDFNLNGESEADLQARILRWMKEPTSILLMVVLLFGVLIANAVSKGDSP